MKRIEVSEVNIGQRLFNPVNSKQIVSNSCRQPIKGSVYHSLHLTSIFQIRMACTMHTSKELYPLLSKSIIALDAVFL